MSVPTIEQYVYPATVEEAFAALGEGVRPIGGGTDLMLHAPPGTTALVDLSGLPLSHIEETPAGFRVGATATLTDMLEHPGLAGHPDHQRAREWFSGYGGMLALELAGGSKAARRFLDSLRVFTSSASLGGVESVATAPALTTHRELDEDELRAAGISAGLVRLSVGIEHVEDLLEDLAQALAGDSHGGIG